MADEIDNNHKHRGSVNTSHSAPNFLCFPDSFCYCVCNTDHSRHFSNMRLAIAPGPTVHWLLRSHDLPFKYKGKSCGLKNQCTVSPGAMASRMFSKHAEIRLLHSTCVDLGCQFYYLWGKKNKNKNKTKNSGSTLGINSYVYN